MIQRKWAELEDAPPSAIIDFDLEFPIHMDKPWTRPDGLRITTAHNVRKRESSNVIPSVNLIGSYMENTNQPEGLYLKYLQRLREQREQAGLPPAEDIFPDSYWR